jgi:hypothetical protein
MRLNKPSSLKYVLSGSFRDRVCSSVLPCHVALRFCEDIYVPLIDLGNASDCLRITGAGLAYLGNVREIDLSSNEGLRHLGNLQSLVLSWWYSPMQG